MTSVFVPDRKYDLLIIGLGPAGVSCALQAHRDGLDIAAIGDEPVGGLVRAAFRLTNLPGVGNLPGQALANNMQTQLATLGVPILSSCVVGLIRCDQEYKAELHNRQIVRAKTVCLATGTRPAHWSLGERLNGVCRDARGLPKNLSGSAVVIIGGGEAALDTSLSVVEKGGRALIVSRSDQLRAAHLLIKQARNAGVEVRANTIIEKVAGGPGEWALTSSSGDKIPAEVLVVCIGRVPRDELLRGLRIDASNYSVSKTGVFGLWLAGDVVRGQDRYVALAMGDGQQAALCAGRYLREGR
jgi:thioredoxin reductase (NADPH)